jgi:hypothetical protein
VPTGTTALQSDKGFISSGYIDAVHQRLTR